MRHQVHKGRKFNRTRAHRRSLLRNLLTSLFENGRLVTTLPKAKELRSYSDRFIARARKASFSQRRKAFSLITRKETAEKFFKVILPTYEDRVGGYSRIVKLGRRDSDGAERARLELLTKNDEDENA